MPDGDDEAGVGAPLGALHPIQARRYSLRRSEQPQRLIHQVTAQIAQQTAVGPGLEGLRLVQIEPRVETPGVAE